MGRNALYYGDCYDVLRAHVPDGSVDLVYLDPPFNSNRDYNVLFKEQTGAPAEAQVKAFTDTWKWSPDLYAEWDQFVETCPNQPLVALMQSFIQYLKRNDVTAYLARMAPRLYELHRACTSCTASSSPPARSTSTATPPPATTSRSFLT